MAAVLSWALAGIAFVAGWLLYGWRGLALAVSVVAAGAVLFVVPLGALVAGLLQLLGCVLVVLTLATLLQRAAALGPLSAARGDLE